MHGGGGHRIPPNEYMLPIHIHMILVALVIHAVLDRPPRLGIFLAPLGWLRLPLGRAVPGLDGRVFSPRVALSRHRDERDINHLAVAGL